MSDKPLRAAFVMEQHVGHRSFYENLRLAIDRIPTVEPTWVEVDYQCPSSRLLSLPIPDSVRNALCGRSQVRNGLEVTDPNVAFFNTQVPAALSLKSARRQPFVLCTDITPLQYDDLAEEYDHTPDSAGPIKWLKHRRNLQLMRAAARIVPWSTWTADSLVVDYDVPREKLEIVAPGVDTEAWRPQPSSNGSGPVRILFVGGDLHRKGGFELLEAFGRLNSINAELHLVTKTRLSSVPHGVTVHHDLLPNSPELRSLYAESDVFVLPTRAEAFGIAAAEASSCGLPTIATRTGGLVDIVDDGVTGYLIEPNDPLSLKQKLELLVGNDQLRLQLGAAARERTLARFDAARNAAKVVDILIAVSSETHL